MGNPITIKVVLAGLALTLAFCNMVTGGHMKGVIVAYWAVVTGYWVSSFF